MGHISVEDSFFSGNEVNHGRAGAAISIDDSENVSIRSSHFTANSAVSAWAGGAVSIVHAFEV